MLIPLAAHEEVEGGFGKRKGPAYDLWLLLPELEGCLLCTKDFRMGSKVFKYFTVPWC